MSRYASGNIAADRRYLWAEASRKAGDLPAAADLFAQALECAPGWPAAAFALGECHEAMGQPEAAKTAFEACLAADAEDPFGAGLRLARLSGRAAPAAMPERYVAQLFDDYAERFDDHLVGALDYRGPAIVRAALEAAMIRAGRPFAFTAAMDLGCGTGLMAAAMAGAAQAMDGIDLSPAMVAKAGQTGLYRWLATGDLVTLLRASVAPGTYDLMLAADVLVYIGDLAPLMGEVRRCLGPGGRFAFTVQAGAGEGYVLGADMRYAHAEAYLRSLAAAHGLAVEALEPAVTRRDAGREVPGFVAVLTATA